MERSSLLKWLLFGAAIFLFFQFVWPSLGGGGKQGTSALQPFAGIVDDTAPPDEQRKEEAFCAIAGPRFKAKVTTKGAALSEVIMTDPQYTHEEGGSEVPIDLVTTTLQSVMPLRTDLRTPAGNAEQVPYDDLDWTIDSQTAKSCTLVYEDDGARVRKTIAATDRPFELSVELEVTNKSSEAQSHRLTVEQTDWRTTKETEGHLGRMSAWMTKTEVRGGEEVVRHAPGDFEPDDFDEEDVTGEKWRRAPGPASWAAVSSSYFSKAVFHIKGPDPAGEMQIEEVWDQAAYPKKENDPNHGHIYRARLNYGEQKLEPGATASYQVLAFVGPKERGILAQFGGGGHSATDIIDMGMFGWIGNYLIRYLYWLFSFTKTWGWAICLLTITVRFVLFPLSISQIKSSMAMRKLKPEMDELNKKYKDDATQRGLAMQELWRKNNVTNPMLGCLPVLLQMPVWFALYTALQSAVELYHDSFAWFPDLSAPDKFYILPILLGASSLLQQHLMPMQGDAMQQKMMKYMMPAMFTVFMLFLPAGLGIYFFTNTWLGIGQQLAVERYYKARDARAAADGPSDGDGGTDDDQSTKKKPTKKSDRPKRARAGTA